MVKVARKCSNCRHTGHNSTTCPRKTTCNEFREKTTTCNGNIDKGCIKLFGVNLMEKNSINNVAIVAGYDSEAAIENNKGKKWTKEEHLMFLDGIEKLGRGDWSGISKEFVKTRTPTQVASHAQKYFLRQQASDDKKTHLSIFDIPLRQAVQGPRDSLVVPLVEIAKTSNNTIRISPETVAPFPNVCLDDSPPIPLNVAYPPNYRGIQQMLEAPRKWQNFLENKMMPSASFLHVMNYPSYGYMPFGNFATCVPVTAHPSNIPFPRSFPPSMFLPGPGISFGA